MTTSTHAPWPTVTAASLEGPWEQAFYFVLRGRVGSKSNYRHGAASAAKWSTLKAFAEHVELSARAARPRGWVTGETTQSVADRPKVVACIFARTMLDAGNLDKSILDAVEGQPRKGNRPAQPGVLMVNDAQVAGTAGWAVRTSEHEGALVAFARLHPTASQLEVATATADLLSQCAHLIDLAEQSASQ